MKKTFREYHQYTKQEFKALWGKCLFVFDANTLLNMYRYSRKTVDIYFKVLTKLKENKQLWIPYQVGCEFYENRINVISEYEKSYDAILGVLENAKREIETKYKNHPFLDLKKINLKVKEGLSSTEALIKEAKGKHPNWLENDEVLEKINDLFKGNIGENYDNEKLCGIKKEGTERYDKKIPPGFKDNKKDDNKKFGDLILWYQIIDKAKESKKPIVFISGDVKEDWWLEENGKRLMPLPQLKKEMYEKASVDFHIYTADRFLTLNKTDGKQIDEKTIKEVRKIRELEEKRMLMKRIELEGRCRDKERDSKHRNLEKFSMEFIHLIRELEGLFLEINDSEIRLNYKYDLERMFHTLRALSNQVMHGKFDRNILVMLYQHTREITFALEKVAHSGDVPPNLSMRARDYIDRLEHLIHQMQRYLE